MKRNENSLRGFFRLIIFILVVLDFILAFVPLKWAYLGNEEVLNWVGVGAFFSLDFYFLYFYLLYFISLFLYIGIYHYKKPARFGLVCLWLLDVVLTPFSGIYVFSGLSMMLFKITLLLTGFLIALSYFSIIKNLFEGERN